MTTGQFGGDCCDFMAGLAGDDCSERARDAGHALGQRRTTTSSTESYGPDRLLGGSGDDLLLGQAGQRPARRRRRRRRPPGSEGDDEISRDREIDRARLRRDRAAGPGDCDRAIVRPEDDIGAELRVRARHSHRPLRLTAALTEPARRSITAAVVQFSSHDPPLWKGTPVKRTTPPRRGGRARGARRRPCGVGGEVIVGTPGDDTLVGTDDRDFIHGLRRERHDRRQRRLRLRLRRPRRRHRDRRRRPRLPLGRPRQRHARRRRGRGRPLRRLGRRHARGRRPATTSSAPARTTALPDVVDCGDGRDRALIRAGDVAVDCERVRTVPARRARVHVQRGTARRRHARRAPRSATSSSRGPATTRSPGSARPTSSSARSGNDTLNGDDGADRLWGGSEDDLLDGGAGPDWLWAGVGADQLFGGEGNDRLFAAADDGAVDTLDCGEHADDRDRAVLRPGDTAVNCERVRTLAP